MPTNAQERITDIVTDKTMTLKQAQDEARRAGYIVNKRGSIRYWLRLARLVRAIGGEVRP